MRSVIQIKRIVFISSALFFLSAGNNVRATHAAGAELRYECLGGFMYRFHFTLYRDCDGIPVAQSYVLQTYNTCGYQPGPLTVTLDSTVELPRTCSFADSRCINAGSPHMGIEANYYHGDIFLLDCPSWFFYYIECCRNAALTNIFNPSGCELYVETTLNNTDGPCNSSPAFYDAPVYFICANQIQYASSLAVDYDGDSLTYQMIAPFCGPGTPVTYLPGYTATQPVSYSGQDSTVFDPLTGAIRMLPDAPQIAAVALLISEYRNGILIGTMERDMQVIIDYCTNNIPELSGMNGVPVYGDTVPGGDTICFYLTTDDADITDSLTLSWSSGIPSAQFNVTGANHPQLNFCWATLPSDARPLPYHFDVEVTDDHCPTFASNRHTYSILVTPDTITTGIMPLNSGPDIRVVPNPSEGMFRVSGLDEIDSWIVYDAPGSMLHAGSGTEIDLTRFPDGIYFLEMTGNERNTFYRILIKGIRESE